MTYWTKSSKFQNNAVWVKPRTAGSDNPIGPLDSGGHLHRSERPPPLPICPAKLLNLCPPSAVRLTNCICRRGSKGRAPVNPERRIEIDRAPVMRRATVTLIARPSRVAAQGRVTAISGMMS